MTREERLSLAIARHFEKEPTWPKGYHNEHARTPGDWWRAGLTDEGLPCWKPHVDPMRLLKELLASPDWQVIIGDCDDKETSPACVEFELTTTEASYAKGLRGFVMRWPVEQLAEGIAECFAKAFNLEV